MKKLFTFLILFLAASGVWGQIISQYVETNSGSYPKGIEIWNNTASTLDFSTNNLVIEKGTNGGVPATDYTLSSGTLASGAVIVIGTPQDGTTATGFQDYVEANGATFYSKAFTFNGDDALVVKYGGTTTDVFGDPGTGDPGTGWSGNGVQTYNQNISLKTGINTGDTDGWTDPSTRFETTSTDPVNTGTGGLDGFGLAPSTSPLPVELTSFNYSLNKNSVNLTWKTATEVNNFGFEIERSTSAAVWQKIGFVEGSGNSNSVKEYSYVDAAVQNGKYTYRLKQVDVDGQFKYSNEIEVEIGTPAKYALEQNYPNPFNPSTNIRFSIPEMSNVKITVFNSIGQEVGEIYNGIVEAGTHNFSFDASNLTSGVYFYKMESNSFTQIRKMLLLR